MAFLGFCYGRFGPCPFWINPWNFVCWKLELVSSRVVDVSLSLVAGGFSFAYLIWKNLRRSLLKELTTVLMPSQINVVTNAAEWQVQWKLLKQDLEKFPVLGFDCEWVTIGSHRNSVALVQLSSISGLCVLVRTQLLKENEGTFPDTFQDLLKAKNILKVGVAPRDDGEKLERDFCLKCHGCVDIRNLVLRCRKLRFRPGGLKEMAKEILGMELDKNYHVRCGDWEAEILNEKQLRYAALDGFVSFKIFLYLLENNFNNPICSTVLSTCQGIVDLKFLAGSKVLNKTKKPGDQVVVNGVNKELKCRAYEARKTPLYHNSKLYSRDGQLLCTCDVKKAKWYLAKNLADKIRDDPLCVRLLFEPSGRPTSETDYYLQEKSNICVVCGKNDSYTRKFIIPHEYRKHLPSRLKEHKSHDVVLMCTHCHLVSDQMDTATKLSLADKYEAKIRSDKYLTRPNEVAKVKSAALALKNNKESGKIPTKRYKELEQTVKEYFSVETVEDKLLEKALSLVKEKQENKDYEEHGMKVMQAVMKEASLIQFEKMWRLHFLETMQPKYLPKQWSVDHGHEKLATMLDDL